MRRRVHALAIALLLILALTAGCSSKPSNSPAPAKPADSKVQQPQQPVKGGVLTTPIISNPAMWPIVGSLPNILVNKALYTGLVKYEDPTLKPVGDLAESWTTSADKLTWTFKLRKDVKWHDGKPFSADDVVFTINEIWLNQKVGFYLRSNFSTLVKAVKVDDYTVDLVTKEPTGNLPASLGYLAPMLPKHILGSWTPEQFAKPEAFTSKPVGTGPFKFKEFVPGSHVRLEANPEFYGGQPYLDAVVFKVMPDLEQQLAQLQSGGLDFVPLEAYQLNALKNNPNVRVLEAKQANYFYIGLNNNLEFFKDKRVRQALSYATDRKAIIEGTLGGKGLPANGPISPFLEQYYNKNAKFYEYDPKKAAALLDEAGWKMGPDGIRVKDGKPFKFVLDSDAGNPVREQTVVIIKELWKQVGVEVTLKTGDFNAMLARIRSGPKTDVQAHLMWYITPADPDVTAYYGTGQSTNTFFYSNTQVDDLLKKGRQETDPAKRAEIYKQFQEVLAEDAPIVFLYYPYELDGISKKVQGWSNLGYRDAFSYLHKVWKTN